MFDAPEFHGDIPLPPEPPDDIPPPPEPPPPEQATLTTWEPIELGPYLRGEVKQPEPSVGAYRSDGVQFLYQGREHAILGGTEAGKTWVALMCVAAELNRRMHVAYVHFEESDPASTVERLRLLGLSDEVMAEFLHFAAPTQRVKPGWLAPLLTVRPSLVVLDGINEAIVLHGQKVDLDGWSLFRQQVIVPFKFVGAAVLGCDHMPISNDESRRDAYGTGHKGNILDGSRLMLVNKEPFGRGMRGRSQLYVTKDRPGRLRIHGTPSKAAGVTFMGTLVVDDSGADFVAAVYAPKPNDVAVPSGDPVVELMEILYAVALAKPDSRVESKSRLLAAAKNDGHKIRRADGFEAINRLLECQRFREVREGRITYLEAVPASGTESGGSGTGSPVPLFKGTGNREPVPDSGGNRPEPAGTDGDNDDQETTK